MKNSKILLLFFLSFFVILTGCKDDEAEQVDRNYYYDPKIPFGNIENGNLTVKDIRNLKADLTELNKITFTWSIPPIYKTIEHQVRVYKRREPAEGFELPSPEGDDSIADLYLRGFVGVQQTGLFVDENEFVNGIETNDVEQDVNYSYWFYIRLGSEDEGYSWSDGVRINLKTPKEDNIFVFPGVAEFWRKLQWELGQFPTYGQNGQPTIQPTSLYSLNGGLAGPEFPRDQVGIGPYDPLPMALDPLEPGNPRMGIDFAESGNVMFVADTNANRIVIYTRETARGCEDLKDDEDLYEACLINSQGTPLTPYNVLGQPQVSPPSPKGYFDCGEPGSLPNSSCMNRPTKVLVHEVGNTNYLFVADTGNNRILVYNRLPIDGCDGQAVPGVTRPVDCEPTFVIGKQDLDDLNSYSLDLDGNSALNHPTDMFMKGNDLYIADTGNNRVVKIQDIIGVNKTYDCTPSTWKTPICSWSAVLGQPNFFSDDYFVDMVNNNPSLISGTLSNEVSDPELLSKYFRAPTRIYITEDNKLLVGANEAYVGSSSLGTPIKLMGRVLIWNENPLDGEAPVCNDVTFNDGSGLCNADDVIGQENFEKLVIQSSGQYNDVQYAIESVGDFDILNGYLILTDTINNLVYVWEDYATKTADGNPASYRVSDPEGEFNEDTQRNLPDLIGISAVRAVPGLNLIFVSDPGGHRVFEIRAFNVPDLE